MNIFKIMIMLGITLSTVSIGATDIAFGTIKGIKFYDYEGQKKTNIHFSDDATRKLVEGCDGVATITHALHSEESIKQLTSIALAAYAAGKKVRANSRADTCELDFLAIQESVF